jgi:hypothetical protein
MASRANCASWAVSSLTVSTVRLRTVSPVASSSCRARLSAERPVGAADGCLDKFGEASLPSVVALGGPPDLVLRPLRFSALPGSSRADVPPRCSGGRISVRRWQPAERALSRGISDSQRKSHHLTPNHIGADSTRPWLRSDRRCQGYIRSHSDPFHSYLATSSNSGKGAPAPSRA